MNVEVVSILSILSILVAIINIYCIVVILYSRRLHKASHMAICSLLIAHALQGLVVIPLYAIRRAKITKDPALCTMFRFTYLFTNYVSCMSLLVISVDRCFGVTFPLKYKIFITPRRMLVWLTVTWVYILALCCIPFSNTSKKCGYIPQSEWTVGMLMVNTMVPFIIIFICYFVIFRKVKKVLHNRKEFNRKMTINSRALRKQWKKSKITVVIVFFYVICWGPGFVYYTLVTLCSACFGKGWDDSTVEQYVGFVIKLLTFVDGIIAPLLYCLSNQSFILARDSLLLVIKLKILKKESSTDGFPVSKSNSGINTKQLHANYNGSTAAEGRGRLGKLKKLQWTSSTSTFSDYSVNIQDDFVSSVAGSPVFNLRTSSILSEESNCQETTTTKTKKVTVITNPMDIACS